MSYPSPCDTCSRCTAPNGCTAWKIRYRYRQKQINAYARRLRIPDALDLPLLQLHHPEKYRQWLKQGPCRTCGAEPICDTACAAYRQWWDERMGWFRRIFYG